MKVVSAKEMARIEALAFSEGASDWEFMERAGAGIAAVVIDYLLSHQDKKRVLLLCGKGNNAGDAYVVGRHLLESNYHVTAIQVYSLDECSPLCQENYHRFVKQGGSVQVQVSEEGLTLPDDCVVLDGILGTGFKGELRGDLLWLIPFVNASALPILSIDIPSGLNGNTGNVNSCAINATVTIFLGQPKTGFFLRDGWNYVGKLVPVDFGLDESYLQQMHVDFSLITSAFVYHFLPILKRTRHKYSAGYVVAYAGSKSMPGAAMLSGLAALRSGAGIVRILHPEDMAAPVLPYEIIKEACSPEDYDTILERLNSASAVYLGPGIGRKPSVKQLIHMLCQKLQRPCVIDADAITLLSECENLSFPKETVLTPHLGEMHRLLGLERHEDVSMELLAKIQNYSEKHHVTIILKGGPTFIIHPHSEIYINPFGNPGMATAGTGDVLTGIVAAFLSQGLCCHEAALLAVYLHSIAGDSVAQQKTPYSLIASDLIERLPVAFRILIST